MFKYKESRILYKLGKYILKILPLPNWIIVRTPYGLLIHPKNFRVFTMFFDLVEPDIKDIFVRWIKDADVFIDIGSFVGWYILKAHKLNPNAIKIAIEPDPSAFNILKTNLIINNIINNNIILLNIACSNQEGLMKIKTCMPFPINEVVSKKLDSILQELNITLTNRSLILIDAEGAAEKSFRGS